ncbi:MAG: EamA family transporter [Deltaproteobacteria bacterium]|nr:MAG: EamA family transporter [Desulfobacteraceae bacterium 4484_190.3]RLB19794.1 MAG: EamA family transporter [Deltaproteobacteria bacterium]
MDKRVLRADWLLLLTAVIWGTAFVAQRAGMAYVGAFTFNGIRFALGMLVLLPLAMWGPAEYKPGTDPGRKMRATPSQALWGGGLAGLMLFSGASLQQLGLVYTTAGKAGFITGLYVIIVPIMGLFWGLKSGKGGWLGAGLAVVGLYLLSVTRGLSIAPGDLLVLLGAFFWAGHVLVVGWLSPKVNRMRLACAQYAVCSGLSLIVAGLAETMILENILRAAVPILYGGIASVGIAYTLQVVAQKYAPPAHAAIILSLESVFAAVAGWLILGEIMSVRGIIGAGLMLAGMLTAQLWS